ncbi:MAG: hypothetical protein Q8L66_07000 [Caulobacter sp.]|nr:hypothetical protein [Caulobacter sp.]
MNKRNQARPAPARNSRQYSRANARVGLVMGQDIDFGDIGAAESIFVEMGVRLAPMSCGDTQYRMGAPGATVSVLPTAGLKDVLSGGLAGIVVPSGEAAAGSEDANSFDDLVKATKGEQLPIMAFGDGVSRTLDALGLPHDETLPAGVLVHKGVRLLETADDLRSAMTVFYRSAA